MNSYIYRTLSCFLCLFLTISGCSKTERPEGLPKLYPCIITITQDNDPVADAAIQLVGDCSNQWPITGLTNASGTASMVTYGQFPGAPVGEYKIVVKKTVEEIITPASENKSGTSNIFSLVDVQYTKDDKTPLEIRIDAGKNRHALDVGKEVRVLVDTIRPGT